MATSLQFYSDAALSSPLTKANVVQRSDGATGPVDQVAYLGSGVANKKIRAASNPGVDNIVLSVVDADGPTGQTAAAVKLATSLAGLDSAVAGDPLTLGTEILSGAANAVAVHIRIEDQTATVGTYTDLSLQTNELVESNA